MGGIQSLLWWCRHSKKLSIIHPPHRLPLSLLCLRQPVSAMSSFLLAMTMYPDVQRKIQAELDSVVGTDRLPTFADRDSLPYLATALKEVIRWGPTTPLGAPHCVEQDDVHNGYFIPKGSIIMPNIW